MKRLSNWEALLADEIGRNLTRGFEWGAYDCALAACDFIRAQTGVDPASAYRGKYHSEDEAAAITGGDLGTFAAGIAQSFGMQEVAPLMAGRGDLVLIDNGPPHAPSGHPQSLALGVVDLTGQYALCAGTRGLMKLKHERWKRAWRVSSFSQTPTR